MSQYNNGVIISKVAGANLSATEYRFVKASTAVNGECLVAGAGGITIGIRRNAPASKAHCSIVVTGTALLTIGTGGCTAGMKLKSDTNGDGINAGTNKDFYGAIALEAVDAGEVAEVLVVQGVTNI